MWANFEAQDKYYPTFRIRFWWTSDCPGWENPMPVRVLDKKSSTTFNSFFIWNRKENSCIAGNLKLVRKCLSVFFFAIF